MQDELDKNFLEKLKNIYSKEELDIIFAWFKTEKRKVTFRVNTLKSSNEEIEQVLNNDNLKFEKISYLKNGYKLVDWKEKDLWDLDIFTDWKIYMQGITSQLIGEIVMFICSYCHPESISGSLKSKNTNYDSEINSEWQDIKILDLTAAPGGKTSHISALLENNWEIVANESNTIRFDKLKFTIERQWCKNVKLVKWDARELKNTYSQWYFDIIIADLPCSAEWRINLHNEKTYKFLEKEWINKRNYKLQQDILKHAISLLKPCWTLIYSTCTLDPLENEGIVHYLLSNYQELEIVDINDVFKDESIKKYTKAWIKSYWKQIYRNEVQKAVRLLPSIETEWFFVAVLKKKIS